MDTPVEKIDVTAGMKFGCLQVLDEGAEYLQVMDERISNIKEEKAEFVKAAEVSDGTLWEGQIALYFRWTCLPDCAVPELDADYRRNNRRLS